MNLYELCHLISRQPDVSVIGRDRVIDGTLCHVIGWSLYDRKLRLHALLYNEEYLKRMEAVELAEWEKEPSPIRTNRMHLSKRKRPEMSNPIQSTRQLVVDGTSFPVNITQTSQLNNQEWESILLLGEFIRQGWQPEVLADPNLDRLQLTSLEMDGEFDGFPETRQSDGTLVFDLNPSSTLQPVELPMTLIVGEAFPEKLIFHDAITGEEHWVQINRVYLLDLWAQQEKTFSDPRLLEQMPVEQLQHLKANMEQQLSSFCPRGLFIPVVEYECEDPISLEFFAKSYLEAEPVHRGNSASAIGLILGADQATGRLGRKLKATTIALPVDSETTSVEVELFHYFRQTEGGEVIL